jgi:ubiquinone/menaquinone biosynthesis C-methylase UbiE
MSPGLIGQPAPLLPAHQHKSWPGSVCKRQCDKLKREKSGGKTMTALSFTEETARKLAAAYAIPEMQAQRAAVLQLADLAPGAQAIDIGCGPGYLSEIMAESVGPTGTVLGLDISPDLIALCESRDPPAQLGCKIGDALDIPYSDRQFDMAICTQVAEYIPDTAGLLAETFRVLRPGGKALVMATDWDCVAWETDAPGRMNTIMQAWERHCAHPRLPRTLAPALGAAGFTDVKVHMYPLLNLTFATDTYSGAVAKLIRDYVIQEQISEAEATDWFEELGKLDAAGRYYFCSARMIFLARKPEQA